MLHVRAALCFIALLCPAAEVPTAIDLSPSQIFGRARENVLQQLKQSTNYTCTEIVDRTQTLSFPAGGLGCSNRPDSSFQRPYMHDRLRLDVAVSSVGEIFSWHGGAAFSSDGIQSIVKTGTVSSGAFIGYLSNVFVPAGVVIRYSERISNTSGTTVVFTYEVPLASSKLQLGSRKELVPFHGSFAVDALTFQLASLDVIIDRAPSNSEICSASMNIRYQIVSISDQPSLIPRTFSLKLDVAGHQSNTSRTDFTDCHAFRGESVIHYDSIDPEAARIETGPPQILPEHVKLHAALLTRIDDRTSYTGDPVEATLISSVEVRGTEIKIPKGALLKGIITRLEFYYEPVPHYRLGIRLDSIVDGPKAYRMDSILQTSLSARQRLIELYGRQDRAMLVFDSAGGEFLFEGKKFHTSGVTTGTWITIRTAGE